MREGRGLVHETRLVYGGYSVFLTGCPESPFGGESPCLHPSVHIRCHPFHSKSNCYVPKFPRSNGQALVGGVSVSWAWGREGECVMGVGRLGECHGAGGGEGMSIIGWG